MCTERAYHDAHPDHADLLAGLSPTDRVGYLRRWLGTFEARRLMVAEDPERRGMHNLAEWVRVWRAGLWPTAPNLTPAVRSASRTSGSAGSPASTSGRR